MQHVGPKIYFVIWLTGAFGLRCGEAVTLKREDIALGGTIPKITVTGDSLGGRKSPGSVFVRKQHVRLLQGYLDKGITCTRCKKHKHGKGESQEITFQKTFHIPESGYIFQSRKNAKSAYLHYHAVYDHVRREAPKFLKHLQAAGKQWGPEIARLRPHSGRATLITELMGEGLCTSLTMKYNRHAPSSYKVHLNYGRLVLHDVKVACDSTRNSNHKRTQRTWSTMSSTEFLKCQKEITAELARRDHLK